MLSRTNCILKSPFKKLILSQAKYNIHSTKYINKNQNPLLTLIDNTFFANKGFGKFERKDKDTPTSKESKDSTSPQNDNSVKENKSKENNSSSNPFGFSNFSKNNSGGDSGGPKRPNNNNNNNVIYAVLLITTLSAVLLLPDVSKGKMSVSFGFGNEITWQEFKTQLLESGKVDRIVVMNKSIAVVHLREPYAIVRRGANSSEPGWVEPNYEQQTYDFTSDSSKTKKPSVIPYRRYVFSIGNAETFEERLEQAQKQLNIEARDFIPVMYVEETSLIHEFIKVLPTLIIIGSMIMLMRFVSNGLGNGAGGGLFRMGKSPAKRATKEMSKTTFADVAGCDEAKREIMEFVEFLKNPKKFTDLGAKIPRGALLTGPPGTGKTLLAKATAGEANVPFFSVSGSDFVEMFVGLGASRVRELFKEAKSEAPCIIFIDEIDAIGRKRGRGVQGGNDERENTLNQLLVEMDGFDTNSNIVMLAGTNRVDILDPALTRPGRFDRTIVVEKPDIAGRKQLFDIYLKNITLDGEIEQYSSRLAALTPGFTGADISNICNEAAIQAARLDKKKVDMVDFEKATDRVIGGLESKKIISPEEKKVIAYHEAGHAVAGWNLEHADPLLKVTIVPRGNGALGFAQYLPKEIFLRTKSQILDIVCMALAGRASEQVNFGSYTTGASDDLRRVTQIVYQMVQVYGMNDKVGQVAFPRENSSGFPDDKMYSNATAEMMDEEVRKIVDEAYKRTVELIEKYNHQVKLVAELLIEKETITNMDVVRLIGKRPFSSGKEYDSYVSGDFEKNSGKVEEKPSEEEETAEGLSTVL